MPQLYEILALVANARKQCSDMVRGAKFRGNQMKPQAIAAAIGMKQAMFYRHLQHCDWKPEDIQKIALLLDPTARIARGGTDGN